MNNCTGNVVWRHGGERTNGWALWRGALTAPFMTTSLMPAVSGQRAPESSESEINEQEPQQRRKQSKRWQATGRRTGNKNKLDGWDSNERRRVFVLIEKVGRLKKKKRAHRQRSYFNLKINKTSTFSTTSNDIFTLFCQLYHQSAKHYLKSLQMHFQHNLADILNVITSITGSFISASTLLEIHQIYKTFASSFLHCIVAYLADFSFHAHSSFCVDYSF